MMIWRPIAFVFAAAVALTACTEKLTTPGSCPTFCPGGQSAFRDTVLTPILNGDSSYTGYVEANSLVSVLASNGGVYGQNVAVIRFLPRGDSVLVSDTNRTFSVDSVTIELGIQDRDTTATNFVVDVYRLPLTIDSTATFTQVTNLFTPANLIAELPEAVSFRTGLIDIHLDTDSLARVAFAASDSTVLQIGIRIRADAQTAARFGTPNAGTLAPLFTTYVEANGVDDTLKSQSIGRIAQTFFTSTPPAPPISSDLLAVGGIPVSRSFIRFALTPFLRDSATIIRATLNLQADAPVIGIPADTALLVASAVLVDFGAKSPVITGLAATFPLLPGSQNVTLEVAPLVKAWQGATATPPIIRLGLGQEGGTFIFPLFRSTRSATGKPTLQITYRPPFGFAGY